MVSRGSSRLRAIRALSAACIVASASLICLSTATKVEAAPAACIAPVGGFSHTGFVTCTGTSPDFAFYGFGTLISDGAVKLNGAGIHIVEYADVVANSNACGVLTCFTQSGWGYGTVGNANSGPYQRPYYERNDVYGYLPYFDTNVGVRCCAQDDGNNTSSFWAGTYDIDNNLKFLSYFNNEVGSGNVELGFSFLPGLVSADLTGEEDYNAVGTLPSVGPVTFALAELDIAHPDSWVLWTTSYPGEVNQDTLNYPFSSQTHYTGFKYSGP